MTGITGITIVLIARYSLVILVYSVLIIMFMANNTTKRLVVARRRVAFGALIPLVFVFPAVNREVHIVVIKSGGFPSRFIMAHQAVRGKLSRLVIGVGGGIKVLCMAAHTGIGRVIIVPVVAGNAVIGNTGMCPI